MKIIINGEVAEIPSGGGPSLDVYSTEETRIGTWIDGKPLYRKCYNLNFNVSKTGVLTIMSISDINVDTLAWCGGTYSAIANNSGIYYRTIPDTSAFVIGADENKATLIMYSISSNRSIINTVILEYTKTTDQATISTETASAKAVSEHFLDIAQAIPVTATVTSDIDIAKE